MITLSLFIILFVVIFVTTFLIGMAKEFYKQYKTSIADFTTYSNTTATNTSSNTTDLITSHEISFSGVNLNTSNFLPGSTLLVYPSSPTFVSSFSSTPRNTLTAMASSEEYKLLDHLQRKANATGSFEDIHRYMVLKRKFSKLLNTLEEPSQLIPQYAIGYRGWNVVPQADGGHALVSVNNDKMLWKYKQKLEAICTNNQHSGAPLRTCMCGVYAFKLPDPIEVCYVVGEVALWGKTICHTDGYRSQYAYPLSLNIVEAPRLEPIYMSPTSTGFGFNAMLLTTSAGFSHPLPLPINLELEDLKGYEVPVTKMPLAEWKKYILEKRVRMEDQNATS